MATFEQYAVHLEKFGPECIVETAAHDLDEKELGELGALIKSKLRTLRLKRISGAVQWIPLRVAARACTVCGRDLPTAYGPRRRRHDQCRGKGKRTTPTRTRIERGSEWPQSAPERHAA